MMLFLLSERIPMRREFISGLIFIANLSSAVSQQPQQWPTHEDNYHIANYHFKDGETIADLRLNYITLGTLHRDAQGHADNAVLLLHGTGGQASTLLNPIF